MATYLITGATSGLGRQLARRLARLGGHRLVLPARDAAKAASLRQELLGLGAAEVSMPQLDLASLDSVAGFVTDFHRDTNYQLDGVLLNAGRQSANKLSRTVDGIESTFAVNHLAHHLLLRGLMPRLARDATIGWTASATHDPAETGARLYGFRGARYTTAARIAQGDYDDATDAQACRDAYATSKLCGIASALAFANHAATTRHFFAFDPGLMPGTGLAQEQGAVLLWVWKHVLPRLARLLPGTSTTERSSAVLLELLLGRLRGTYNGAYFNYTGKQLAPAGCAQERWLMDDLCRTSDELLVPYDSERLMRLGFQVQ